MSAWRTCPLILLLVFSCLLDFNEASIIYDVNGTEAGEKMVPLMDPLDSRIVFNETRRKLGSFQICALCTCCGGARGICLLSPCCYAINCNIPNRPFGFCSFTPRTCNCFGCHI